jgi:hypothetical protein
MREQAQRRLLSASTPHAKKATVEKKQLLDKKL